MQQFHLTDRQAEAQRRDMHSLTGTVADPGYGYGPDPAASQPVLPLLPLRWSLLRPPGFDQSPVSVSWEEIRDGEGSAPSLLQASQAAVLLPRTDVWHMLFSGLGGCGRWKEIPAGWVASPERFK